MAQSLDLCERFIDMKKFVAPLPPSILSHRHALIFTVRAKTTNNFEFIASTT